MMKWKTLTLALLLCLVASTSAQAVDWEKIFCLPWSVPQCVKPTCCDDYCPKSMPCVPQVRCFTCDDYCPKSAPCVKKICRFGCDDYCYKCPPRLLCPPTTFLKCAPSSSSCSACKQCVAQRGGMCKSCQKASDSR